MSQALVEKKVNERRFLEQLLDGTKLDKFLIPIPIKCDLRKYQQVTKWSEAEVTADSICEGW